MVGKEIKKILVFGMPRSGTTVLQQQLSHLFELDNLVEPELDESPESPYHWIGNQNNCVLKYLTTQLVYLPLFKFKRLIDHGKFDLIVLTERSNLTDCCISLYYAQKVTQRFHYLAAEVDPDPVPFECDMNFVDDCVRAYKKYIESKQFLDKTNIPYSVVHYESYINNIEQSIGDIKFCISESKGALHDPKLEYSKLCTNYKEVETRIKESLTNDQTI